jgi:uncharacterized membrane protein
MDRGSHLLSPERRNDPARVLALSDGVFAIAMTLLVFQLQVPSLTGGQTVGVALQQVWPTFVAFAISFIVVAIAWEGHRDLFSLIKRTNRAVIWLNFVYLLPMSMLPFGVSLIARFDRDPTALRIFGLLLVLSAVTRVVGWVYATGQPQILFRPVGARLRWAGVAIAGVPGIAYAAAIALIGEDPTVSVAIYAAGPILHFITLWLARTFMLPGSEEQDLT